MWLLLTIATLIQYWIITPIISLISKPFPKNKKLVLFGAMNGLFYGDNSQHLFEWTLKNRPDLRPVWLTKNKNLYDELKKSGKPVALMQSIKGIKCLLRAKCGVFTNSLYDLAFKPYLIPGSIKLIALRHGRSVKKVRFARENHKISFIESIERKKETALIKYAISTSEFISEIQEKCLLIGREKHKVTGYPRNDILISPTTELTTKWQSFSGNLEPNHSILYGPSWRHGRKPTRFFPFKDFDEEKLVAFLENKKIQLLLRPHVNDLKKYPELRAFLENLENKSRFIRFASHHKFPDINSILPFIDLLISDYSALYHDFLLLDRPLMFVPYDYEEFNNKNGFLYDYYHNLPGPDIPSLKDFMNHVEQVFNDHDPYQENRRNLKDKIHYFQDDQSTSRVAKLIDDILLQNHNQ